MKASIAQCCATFYKEDYLALRIEGPDVPTRGQKFVFQVPACVYPHKGGEDKEDHETMRAFLEEVCRRINGE